MSGTAWFPHMSSRQTMQGAGVSLPAHARVLATMLAVAVVGASGCGSSAPADPGNPDAAPEQRSGLDAALDALPGHCEVNWEETPSPLVQHATTTTHYTRPFFTMCKEGKFYWNEWEVYEEGISPEEAATSGHEIRCPSGQCKRGICREDAEYIEGQIPEGTTLFNGVLLMDNKACSSCNPNNKAYAFTPMNSFDNNTEYFCEGTHSCCWDPAEWDGPCPVENWFWSIGIVDTERSILLTIGAAESEFVPNDSDECLDSAEVNCYPDENARCVAGSATLMTSHWTQSSPGWFVLGSETLPFGEVRLTIGTTSRMKALMATPQQACVPTDRVIQRPFTYWTCSGTATVKLDDGRWFRVVWLHSYGPESCDKPCWMANYADSYEIEGIPVKYAFWEIPPEPKW